MKTAAAGRGREAEPRTATSRGFLRATAERSPRLGDVLRFLFRGRVRMARFQDLRIAPILGSHRNAIREEPFRLSRERFGCAKDVPLIPLLRNAVDQTLGAYAYSLPDLSKHIGRTPISPHGSMALSVTRWGQVDWDYVRDMDFRIFLPPQLGHLSGFKTDLAKKLTSALRERGLNPVLLGRDEQGRAQVQLRDLRTGVAHGFHLFLIGMHPGFVRANLHRDGGYSPHYAHFPEGSIDEHLEAAGMKWPHVIRRQTEDYTDMFDQLSFNIFGEDAGRSRRWKTAGWYLRKAFKWYATLARMRGWLDLEEDLLYQYDHFQRSEEEFSYLARYRYYARMAPNRLRMEDLERDLARVDSLVYASARSGGDRFVGTTASADGLEATVLEAVPEDFCAAAGKLLEKEHSASRAQGGGPAPPAQVRFADSLAEPRMARLANGEAALLIPSEWSLVFSDSYLRLIVSRAKKEGKNFTREETRRAVTAVLASLVCQAHGQGAPE